ncbi:hypothetical protein [Desulfofalx alkaliphila]|uniref:hypothetical protein n=1 Tax=Desulfofalx alkaliphila TaxID=105483 RepID=UPI0004E1D49C|nr:hypothetical protein [Desulfofalx alkaliphila]
MDRYLNALQKFRKKILERDNVVGVGVGQKEVKYMRTKQLSLVVLVEKKLPPENLKRSHLVPSRLEGVDTDVIEVGQIKMLSDRNKELRPALPGCSIAHYRVTAGTFGAVVRDRRTGERLILSNNHVLANSSNGYDGRCAIGDAILQPGSYDGGDDRHRIATLARFVPINRGSEEKQATCALARSFSTLTSALVGVLRPNYRIKVYKSVNQPNTVDCAVARPDRPDVIGSEIMGLGTVQGVADVKPGMTVKKSGRTTGVSRGTVKTIGTSLKVQMDGGKESVLFTDQITADLGSKGGDSGSLVLTEDNYAVGLLFAGSDRITVFNRIQNVLDALEVDF